MRYPAMGLKVFLICCAAWIGLATTTQADSTRVIVISDLNSSYGSTTYSSSVVRAIERIIELDPEIVLSTGDMVAGQRRPLLSETQVREMWRGFHATVTDPLAAAGIPLAVSPGNHDASAYSGFEMERDIYAEEWLARQPDVSFTSGSNYPFYYAFDIGPTRFISLDVTTVGALSQDQMGWLGGTVRPGGAQIAFSHLPLWPFAIGRETQVIGDRDLERLFVEMDVDLHLSGHHHAFYPGSVDGLAVVSQACLGSGPRRLIGTLQATEPAITIIDIDETGSILISALKGPQFDRPIMGVDLPPAIQSSMRRIERLDLSPVEGVTWQDLTAPKASN